MNRRPGDRRRRGRRATIALAQRWVIAELTEVAVTAYEARLIELIDRLDSMLGELREAVRQGPPRDKAHAEAVEAFADEALRARDA
jgi:hypothetical protein